MTIKETIELLSEVPQDAVLLVRLNGTDKVVVDIARGIEEPGYQTVYLILGESR